MLAARITLAHFPVSSTISFATSGSELAIAMFANGNNANVPAQFALFSTEARALSMQAVQLDVRDPQDIEPAFTKASASRRPWPFPDGGQFREFAARGAGEACGPI
jgi:hypothetical protein